MWDSTLESFIHESRTLQISRLFFQEEQILNNIKSSRPIVKSCYK